MYELIKLMYVNWTNVDELKTLNLIAERVEDTSGQGLVPVRLGRGRFATVVAATDGEDLEDRGIRFFALKFLVNDRESISFSRNARSRFFLELRENIRLRDQRRPFATFEGCSRIVDPIWEHAFEDRKHQRLRREEEAFLTSNQQAKKSLDLSAQENAKRLVGVLHPAFTSRVQGEFFVMPAEEGSVEDFLLDSRPWGERTIFYVDKSRYGSLRNRIEENRKKVKRFFDKIQEPKTIQDVSPIDAKRPRARRDVSQGRDDSSGFSILNRIGRYLPSVKNRVSLQMVEKLVASIESIHTEFLWVGENERIPLAHRDLKPGNFLISHDTDQLTLTDFGFVAPVTERWGGTIEYTARESGMFALGSRPFRGPEQRDAAPPPEVRFRIVGEQSIELRELGETSIQNGDRLESLDVRFGAGTATSAQMLQVERQNGRVIASLSDKVMQPGSNSEECLGFIVKSSGQHTDIFAIGSLLYYLATGGQSGEELYEACLKHRLFEEEQESCLALALAMCAESPEQIAADLASYTNEESPLRLEGREILEVAGMVRYDVGRAFKRLTRCRENFRKRPELNRVMRFWRESPYMQTLMRDLNGHPLPFPLIYEVIRCLKRLCCDSYVDGGEDSSTVLAELDCSDVTGRLRRQLQCIWQHTPSLQVRLGSYWPGGDAALDLFVTARYCWPESENTELLPDTRRFRSVKKGTVDSAKDREEEIEELESESEGGTQAMA